MSIPDDARQSRRGPGLPDNPRISPEEDPSVVYRTTMLCQPDQRKSCTACCGLFNFMDISRERLSSFLADGAVRSSFCVESDDIRDRGDDQPIRDAAAYICPHQGLIYNRRPGCLIHPRYRNTPLRKDAFFGESICNGFTCPAYSILSTEQKNILIRLLDDWYRYTVALIDPDAAAWLLRFVEEEFSSAPNCDEIAKSALDECLMIHAGYMGRYRGPLFFYSVPEYTIGKKAFTLPRESEDGEREMRDIIAAIRRHRRMSSLVFLNTQPPNRGNP